MGKKGKILDPKENLHPKQRTAFLTCANEILFGGAAGGGKSFFMRWFAIFCAMRCPGIQIYLFRRTHPDLTKNHMQGPTSLPNALAGFVARKVVDINYGKGIISFANGSRIFLCHCQYEKDVTSYQGAEIHLLLIDELTHFSETIYRYLRGRCRLGSWKPPAEYKGRFPRILNGSNPGGIGHNWVKETFVTAAAAMKVWRAPKDEGGMTRVFIPAKLADNPTMAENDPDYEDRLSGLGDPSLVKAMLDGDWDIVAGGALDDVWSTERHMIEPFDVPGDWHVDRSFDRGSTHPFSVGWWAMSNGEDVKLKNGVWRFFPKGSLIRINEWYGWNGKANQGCKMLSADISKGILEREILMRDMWPEIVIHPGPADSEIFAVNNGVCIADDMATAGVRWTKADKGPGSRVNGLEKVRGMLGESKKDSPEGPGMWAFNHCFHFRRTLPVLPRDEKKRDDVDTHSEDHLFDEVKYRAVTPIVVTSIQEV